MRNVFIVSLILGLISTVHRFACAAELLDPAAIEILKKVELSRTETKPFRLKGSYSTTDRGDEASDQWNIEMAYDEGKYWVQAVQPGRRRKLICTSVFDGKQFLAYDNIDSEMKDGGAIFDPTQQRPVYAIDPRALGISRGFAADSNLSQCLNFHSATRVQVIGSEMIAGAVVKIVGVTEQSGREIRYWIDVTKSFRVVKYSVAHPRRGGTPQTTISESEFWPGESDEWIPRKIRIASYDTDEASHMMRETVVEFGRPLRPAHVSPETWTLKGLGMPVGRPVIAPKTKLRIGYWDGENLTRDPMPASK